ncbi:plastocyanin/azurin family copper-binding protein [Pontibacter akesuensis]|uniref:Azurin n=1 Tax=Pontibacter akesuensis TaxID=388950 RepID=A0A1I7G2A7_9BACT|nr:plastocyanin/azurin family copper-binding protein [Pontibacter akesuensis]GHA59208.1 hypothetical protein GCM10007389_09020 [Pontibacter akesuensis]SFU42588.1 Azurin [Pontibacter akesuensis]
MRKKYSYLLLLPVMLLACNQPEAEDSSTKEMNIPTDSSSVASAPIASETDTTLQKKQELTLRALGNTLDEIRYDTDTLEVEPGAFVKLTFVNEGTDMPMVHNVVFTEPGKYKQVALAAEEVGASGNYVPNSPAVIASSPMALPGQTVELEFTAPLKKGYYSFVCTYPDHWHKMHGVLEVK